MIYQLLFYEFCRIGLFAFGGGLVTIPFLFELSKKYTDWFSVEELADMIAISESTPGPIGINMATYCGYNVAGILGSLVATLSLVLPSFIILYIVSKYMYLTSHKLVRNGLYGLRVAVVVLFLSGFWNIFKLTFNDSSINYVKVAMFVIIFALSNIFKKIPAIAFILASGLAAVFIF